MSDTTPQIKKNKTESRIDKTNNIVDDEVAKQLSELEIVSSDLDAIVEILQDRVVQSTDAVLAIALARFYEIRMDTFKKRNDILKTLVSDKSIDVSTKKKSQGTDIDSILSGIGLGAALGATVSTQKSINEKKSHQQTLPFTTIDIDAEESTEFETEHLNIKNTLKESSITDLLSEE